MAVFKEIILLVVVVLAVTFCSAKNPGTKLRINQRGVDHAGDVVVKMFENKLRKDGIPNASGSSGRVSWSIWSIKIGALTSPRSTITVSSAGVKQVLTIQRFSVSASWRAKYKRGWVKASTSGRISATASGITITNTVSLGKTTSGQPTMRSVSCSGRIGGLSVKFSGGLSWIINKFKGSIARKVKSALQAKICPITRSLINTKGNAALLATKLSIPVIPNVVVDYRLDRNPVFAAGHMDIDAKGEALWRGEASQTSLTPEPLTLGSTASKMLYVEISDYTLNTLSEVLFRHGKLQASFSKSLTVSGTPLSIAVTTKATAAPVVDTTPSRLRLIIKAKTIARVTADGSTQTLTILSDVTLSVRARITGNKLTLSVTSLKTNNRVTGSPPEFSVNELVNGIVPNVKQFMNQEGAKGLELPVVKYAKYVNPSLQLRQGSILVSTDIKADIL